MRKFLSFSLLSAVLFFAVFIFWPEKILAAQCCVKKLDMTKDYVLNNIDYCNFKTETTCDLTAVTPDRPYTAYDAADTAGKILTAPATLPYTAANEIYQYVAGDKVPKEEQVECEKYIECKVSFSKEQKCDTFNTEETCRDSSYCFWYNSQCLNRFDKNNCGKILDETLCGGDDGADVTVCGWSKSSKSCLSANEKFFSDRYDDKTGGLLPYCAKAGNCRNINDLVEALLELVNRVFGFIGAFALIFFIYGGIMMITSMGNSERVDKGKQILKAAIIGIIIAFGAYMLINFITESLNFNSYFKK